MIAFVFLCQVWDRLVRSSVYSPLTDWATRSDSAGRNICPSLSSSSAFHRLNLVSPVALLVLLDLRVVLSLSPVRWQMRLQSAYD
jgi:hypothetical protein